MRRKRPARLRPQHGGMTDTPAAIAVESAPPREAAHRPTQRAAARYTTYPMAGHFDARFGAAHLTAALSARRVASQTVCTPLAVQVLIPFHDAPRHGTHARADAHRRERDASYLDALEREVALVVEQVGPCRTVSRLHLGGGSPGGLSEAHLARLLGLLRRNFHLEPDVEVAIDIDPAAFDAGRLAHLRELGVGDVILTLADAARATLDHVADLMSAARGLAFAGIDVELADDIPIAARTLADVAALRPDRIALGACERRPVRANPAPVADDETARAVLGSEALSCLAAAGYEAIGLGRFALRGNVLAAARREGGPDVTSQVPRAQFDRDVLGLGVAAIGRIGDCLYQNARTLAAYHGALEHDRLPVTHGHVVDADDALRGDVIEGLMSRGRVDFAHILARHGVDLRSAFAAEIARLAPFVVRGLVELHGDRIVVTPAGRHAADEIAAVFDRYLHERVGPARPGRAVR